MIEAFGSTMESAAKKKVGSLATQADSPIKFSQLSKGNDLASAGDIFELGLSQALGTSKKESAADFSSSKLSKVTQLTGFSDPVYAEAYVHVHQYDIVLDVLIVNQTSDTLQNVTLELATLFMIAVEQPLIVTWLSSMTSILTSWITLYRLLVPNQSSDRCGQFLNGKIKWLSIPPSPIYMTIWNTCSSQPT